MVEYAVLLANITFRDLAAGIADLTSGLSWNRLWIGLFALVALRIAFWAFRSSDY